MDAELRKMMIGGAAMLIIGVGVYVALRRLGAGVAAAVPQVVKDGAEASYVLAEHVAHVIADPLDAFGVVPAKDATGVPKWEPTVPWKAPGIDGTPKSTNDPVSDNDLGINFNYF